LSQSTPICLNKIGAGRLFILARFFGANVAEFYEGLAPPRDGARAREDLRRIDSFLGSEEGLRLNLDYLGIEDRRIRKCVLDLLSFANGR
jgi:hypothetical protein